MKKFKSGFVAIIGTPNVGKSTLINNLLGYEIAITNPKPETTRSRILGVLNNKDYQIAFIDTPGINYSVNLFDDRVNKIAYSQIEGNDIIYFMVDKPYDKKQDPIVNRLNKVKTNVFLIINKIDSFKNTKEIDKIILSYKDKVDFKEYIPISAKTSKNLDILTELTIKYLNYGPKLFDETFLTDQTSTDLIQEFIREQILIQTEKEIPYASAVIIDRITYDDQLNKNICFATIIVERDSQKKILIGKQGSRIKQIRIRAQRKINKSSRPKFILNLYVKTKKDWRNNNLNLDSLKIGV